ncbi:crotonase/enoyl-CoA hydratase family protein [Brevirhabdus sp.]|uniref:crotonase/enoyl-CoA hydratase family protein n=1 Tax=Brevirhabdus sp. TaxID=2004514 RepID=UPI0040592F4A
MAEYQTITLDVDARGVARLTLNLPERRNALSARMLAELVAAARWLDDEAAVRVVVLTGAGGSFCAGGDLAWMRAQIEADARTRASGARALAEMLDALNRLSKPLIGRIQGQAFGGGIGLMSVCDVAIGVETARFGLTETRLGLIPATIGPYVAARMGEAKARRVFMSGRLFDAAEACALDLLARRVPAAALDAAVEEEILPYLATAPGAVAAAKRLLRALGPRIDREVIEMSVAALVAQWEGDEAAEGIAAFFDKRAPRWAAG